MSSENAIKINGLGKCYHIYDKPRDRLMQMLLRGRRRYFREFWALRGLTLEIAKGETVGIIGRNGSGKSTLLQLICGTLNPSVGSVQANGRIAALLELGAGFNPEFTGRENVYMAAALYGLSKAEVNARFDAIAAFADIGEFIEQPVKTYSSGMFVRLAFAVIAHVDADILVVDEALAVGDAVFTQKCMRFIRQFKENGTLLFVSHDMGSVLNLCQRAVWLHAGEVREIGESKQIADAYLHYTLQELYGEDAELRSVRSDIAIDSPPDTTDSQAPGDEFGLDYNSHFHVCDNLSMANGWKTGAGEILSVRLERLDANHSDVLKGGEMVRLVIRAIAHQNLERPILGFLVRDRLGQDLFGENTLPFTDLNPTPVAAGRVVEGEFTFKLPMLQNGQYAVMASLADGNLHENIQHHWLHDALVITVASSRVRWGLVGAKFEKVNLREIA